MLAALFLGLLIGLQYLVIAVNYRAVAHARYAWVAITDASILVLNFTLIRRVAEASTVSELACYIVGGTCGALAGVWLSRRWSAEG